MTTGRYRRGNATLRQVTDRRSQRENNFFLAIIGLSLLAHTIVASLFLYTPASTTRRRPPTLSVDLVMAPVANPQRGSAGASRKIPAPVAVEKVPALPTKVAKDAVVLKGKEVKKTPVVKDDDGLAEAMAKMKQRKAEQDELQDTQAAIAALKKKTTPAPPATAAVGSATGSGDEAGSAIGEWLQHAVKEKWSWPDRKQKNLSAEIEVEFDVRGKLSKCEIRKPSSDPRFDASLKRAILSIDPLPMRLHKPYNETILFNLDELQGP